MSGTPRKPSKPHPSYEDGHLRDPEIAAKQDPDFQRSDLEALVKRAVQNPPRSPLDAHLRGSFQGEL